MKKIIAAASCALTFAIAFAVEANVTVDFSSDAVRLEMEKGGNTTIKSFVRGGRDDYTANSITFSVGTKTYGGAFAIGFADNTRHYSDSPPPNANGIQDTGAGRIINFLEIDRLSAWVRLAGLVQLEAGKFTDRKVDRLTSVIDDYQLGIFSFGTNPVSHSTSPTTSTEWVQNYGEADRLGGPFLAGFYVPKTDVVIEWAVEDQDILTFDKDGNNTSTAARGLLKQTGLRVRGSIMKGLKVTAAYRWFNEDGGSPTGLSAHHWYSDTAGYIDRQYRNNLGVYVNINLIPKLKILAGYTGSLALAATDDAVITAANLNKDDFSVFDLRHAVDLRAEYALGKTITFATHNNLSLGEYDIKSKFIANSVQIPVGAEYIEIKKDFILENAVACKVNIINRLTSSRLSITGEVKNILTVGSYEEKKPNAGINQTSVWTMDRIELLATLVYAPGENVAAKAGVGVGLDTEPALKVTNASGTFSANPGRGSRMYVWVPVGLQVKF
jgi:hypothetical protein